MHTRGFGHYPSDADGVCIHAYTHKKTSPTLPMALHYIASMLGTKPKISSCPATMPNLSAVLRGIRWKHGWAVVEGSEGCAIEGLDNKTRRNKLKQARRTPLSACKSSYGATDHFDTLQRVARSRRSVPLCSGPRAGVRTASKQWVPSEARTVVSPTAKSFHTKESHPPLFFPFLLLFLPVTHDLL